MSTSLKIYTFGNFRVENGGQQITRDRNKSTKHWKLLQYLITYSEQEIPRDELIMVLGLNNNDDPENNLSALVYRLRKYLTRHVNKENDYYIKTTGLAYTFNNNAEYWLDAEEFENLCEKTQELIQSDSTKAVDVFKEALSLYNGNYLPNAQTEEWLWSARNYYRDLLKNTMLKVDKFFRHRNEYERLKKLYEEVQPLIKFDEKIIAGFLKTMIEMDRTSEAQQRFNEIRDMYKEEGLVLPPLLKNIFAEMVGKIEDPEVFLENLNEVTERDGAYLCTPEKFMEIYELEKRRAKRDMTSRFLIHFRLVGDNIEKSEESAVNHINDIGEQFLQLLAAQLRIGDIVCRCHKKHFIALLINLDLRDAEKICRRLENSFKARYELSDNIEIKTRIQELASTTPKK